MPQMREPAQHEVRMNRVWSLRLNVETCGLTIVNAQRAEVDEEGNVSSWRKGRRDFNIFQWSQKLPKDGLYTTGDLLADFGQTRKLLKLSGVTKSGGFVKVFWISPVGASDVRIPKPPLRDSRFSRKVWNVDEKLALDNWISRNHKWGAEAWYRSFSVLGWKFDGGAEASIRLEAKECGVPVGGGGEK